MPLRDDTELEEMVAQCEQLWAFWMRVGEEMSNGYGRILRCTKVEVMNKGYTTVHGFDDFKRSLKVEGRANDFHPTPRFFHNATLEKLQHFSQVTIARSLLRLLLRERKCIVQPWTRQRSATRKGLQRNKGQIPIHIHLANGINGGYRQFLNSKASCGTGFVVGMDGVFDGLGFLFPALYSFLEESSALPTDWRGVVIRTFSRRRTPTWELHEKLGAEISIL